MFSPANSYPGLTKAVDGVTTPGEPDSYYPNGYRNYARDINTDDAQVEARPAVRPRFTSSEQKTRRRRRRTDHGQGIGVMGFLAASPGKIGGGVIRSANGTAPRITTRRQ